MKKILVLVFFTLALFVVFSLVKMTQQIPANSNTASEEHKIFPKENSTLDKVPVPFKQNFTQAKKSPQEEANYLKSIDAELERGKRLTVEEFQSLAEVVLHVIPTKEALKSLTEAQVHHTPAPVLEAGKILGVLAQAISNEPMLAGSAISTYEACVRNVNFMESVRALCFFNYKKYSNELRQPLKDEVGTDRIRELAKRLE